MTSILLSRHSETSPLSFILAALKSLGRRMHAPRRKQLLTLDDRLLLQGLDHHILRDMGLK